MKAGLNKERKSALAAISINAEDFAEMPNIDANRMRAITDAIIPGFWLSYRIPMPIFVRKRFSDCKREIYFTGTPLSDWQRLHFEASTVIVIDDLTRLVQQIEGRSEIKSKLWDKHCFCDLEDMSFSWKGQLLIKNVTPRTYDRIDNPQYELAT